jgi:glycosyltransferase involved in cell wall biosynthesis
MVKESGGLIPRLNYYFVAAIPRLVVPHADHLIVKSRYQLNTYNSIDTDGAVIPTGVDFSMFNAEKVPNSEIEKQRQKFSISSEKKTFLHLGKLIQSKGIDKLTQHINNLSQETAEKVEFVIVGEFTNDEFRSEITEMIQGAEVEITLYPNRIPFSDVPSLLAAIDCVVLLSESKTEGVPRVLQEAVAMERPIITSDVVGIREAFKDHYGCFLINRDDSEQFEQAIWEVLDEEYDIDRKNFFSKFDIHENYSKYEDIYLKCTTE